MLGLKKLKPDKQRQKLEEMVARFEAESPEVGTGETFLHKACQAGNAAAAAALIALAPETGQLIRDESGLLPVDHAILNGHRSAAAVALRGLPLEELNTLSLLLLPLLLQTGNLELPQQASLNAGLRAAAASGRDAAVELLIKNRAEVNSEQDDGATALVLASRPGHISVARQLLSAGACPDQGNRSALRVAAETGRLDLVKLLLEHRADVEASKAKRGGSPLLFAAKGGHLHCMEELLRASASLEGNKEWLPLHAAVQSGKEAVQLLLSARASPSVPARTWAPLHEAARRRSVITTELLLNHGSPIDAATADGATALHLAVQQGHEETVQVLLSRGASAGCRALSGAAPLHYAVQQGHLQLVQLLLAKNADPDQSMVDAAGIETDCRPLHFAAQLGLQDILKTLLAARASAETEMRGGFTPLALAARAGHMTCCQILLEANVLRPRGTRAIDAVTATGWTPLHLACKAGQLAVARALLELGASVNLLSKRGRTPLMVAIEAGHIEIVKVLVRCGADLELTMPGQWTALHLACLVPRNGAMLHFLLQHAQLTKTDEGWTPLHLAVQSGDESNVKAVLEVQSVVEAPSMQDVQVPSPLHLAAEAGQDVLVRMLLEKGAPVDALASHSITALHLAAGAGGSPEPPAAAQVAEALLVQGATVDLVMEGGATPLMVAARLGRLPVVRVLLQYGADVFSKLPSGWCSFLLAVRNGHAEVVRMLARPEHAQVKTPAGRTPVQCAKKYGHSQTELVLRQMFGE